MDVDSGALPYFLYHLFWEKDGQGVFRAMEAIC